MAHLQVAHNERVRSSWFHRQSERKIKDFSHPPGAELAAAPNTGVELACCPKTGAALGLAPKAGAGEGAAVKGDPKGVPKEGVWLAPKPPEGAELNTNGEGAADGAGVKKREDDNINTCTDYKYKGKI